MDEKVRSAGILLNDRSNSLAARFRALFLLRNIKSDESVEYVCNALIERDETSALLKHELAYCLGQMQNQYAIPHLIDVLNNNSEDPMVRHECAEALGALGAIGMKSGDAESALHRHLTNSIPEIAETCQLALARIRWTENDADEKGNAVATENCAPSNSTYDSIDPAPSLPIHDLTLLEVKLMDAKNSLWDRYRAMFALRNLNTDDAAKVLAKGLFSPDSALFRHEIAYVLGQMQSASVVDELKSCLVNSAENPMVRHEAAEALGAIATNECIALLQQYAHDDERVVRESCEVALDMAEYERSANFQYATVVPSSVQLPSNQALK